MFSLVGNLFPNQTNDLRGICRSFSDNGRKLLVQRDGKVVFRVNKRLHCVCGDLYLGSCFAYGGNALSEDGPCRNEDVPQDVPKGRGEYCQLSKVSGSFRKFYDVFLCLWDGG